MTRALIVLHLVPLPAGPEDPPSAIRLRTILKTLLRQHSFKCVHGALLDGSGLSQNAAEDLEVADPPSGADVAALRQLVRSLARRVAEQAELLARRAEKARK